MYIFGLAAKLISDLRRKLTAKNTIQEINAKDQEICEHIYLAIDSTKDYLACNKCGHVIKNSKKIKN